MRSETKIFNLETHEFGSNLPLKKTSRHFHFVIHFSWKQKFFEKIIGGKCLVTSGGNWSFQKKSEFENLELFFNSKFRKTPTDHTSLAHPPPMLGPTTMMSPPHFR
jgi:hypothetical protein